MLWALAALHFAERGHTACLTRCGAQVGETAIMAAVCFEQWACAELLSAEGGPGLLKVAPHAT